MKTPPIICCLFAVVLASCPKKQNLDQEESIILHPEAQKVLDALDSALDDIPECVEGTPETDCEEEDVLLD